MPIFEASGFELLEWMTPWTIAETLVHRKCLVTPDIDPLEFIHID